MTRPLRLLTLGHSYVVGPNRALAHAMAQAGAGAWEVTVAAPDAFPGDLGPIRLDVSRTEPCRVVPLSVRGARRIHGMTYGRALRRLLRDGGWDVVHAWEEPFVAAGVQVARWTPGSARLVFATFQNLPKRYPPPFRWMEGYAMRRAAGWVAFGRTVEETLRGRPAYAARPHRVIAPGVDAARFRPHPEAGRRIRASLGWDDSDRRPVVGFLGRFVPEKGIATLTRALDAVSADWRALFVGGGAGEGALRAWAVTQGDRVRIATGVGHAEVPAWLSAMDVLCAPSETTPGWREQFGRMLVEAMACGVPVIGSDSGEIPHVVGDAGLIAPERDVAAWARAIEALLSDPALRARLSAAGRARAAREFAMDVVARRHLDFFESLLGR